MLASTHGVQLSDSNISNYYYVHEQNVHVSHQGKLAPTYRAVHVGLSISQMLPSAVNVLHIDCSLDQTYIQFLAMLNLRHAGPMIILSIYKFETIFS